MSKTEKQSEALRLAEKLDAGCWLVGDHGNPIKEAVATLRRLDAENRALRGLAATCYAGLGAECNLPESWLDALKAAADGEPFGTEGLLPFTATEARDETIRQLEAQIKSLTSDADRLDHLQRTGSTIDLLPACGSVPVRFRVGGLAETVSMDIRSAIDAARAAKTGGAA